MAAFNINPYSILYTIFMVLNSPGDLDTYKTVVTENGAVRGRLNSTYLEQKLYYAFRGIPYAKPPIGELRFKATEPVENWFPQVLDATEFVPTCMMPVGLSYPQVEKMDENCLNMNIYVPGKKKIIDLKLRYWFSLNEVKKKIL